MDERRRRNLKLDLNLDLVAVLRTAKLIVNAARGLGEQGLVVRLMDGDPALFHGVADEALELARAGVPFEWAAPGAVVFGVLAWWVVLALPGVVGIAAAAGAVTTDRRI